VAQVPKHLQEAAAVATSYKVELTDAEKVYYLVMKSFGLELACVGAGLGGGFMNTQELHPIKFKEAMKGNDHSNWDKSVACRF
jgi:hypothetical protein